MLPQNNNKANIDRFLGFADTYDKYRPSAPNMITDILTNYLGKNPEVVIDLGCGTGLSTMVWKDIAKKVIGIEPNVDMRSQAEEKLKADSIKNINFQAGYSNQMNIEANSANIVTCSQSFHWMEPKSTLEEVSRVLIEGGIFAAYDCDWPPTVDWVAEAAYMKLIEKTARIILSMPDTESKAKQWNKNEHLSNIKESKRFSFVKEIVFHNKEKCTAERYFGLALSQGGLQTILKNSPEKIEKEIEIFKNTVFNRLSGKEFEIIFSYRMRLGIK